MPPSDKHKLGRLNILKPHSKDNTKWMTPQEEREIFSGTEITAFGKLYKTCSELSKEYNISLSTLLYRLKNGLSPEEAINQIKKTAPQKHSFDNILFDSKTQMLQYIANKFGITFGKAKDRYDRNLPFDHQPFTGNRCTVLGNEFTSEKEAVAFFGVSYSSYNKKKSKGFSPEKAILSLITLREKTKNRSINLFSSE